MRPARLSPSAAAAAVVAVLLLSVAPRAAASRLPFAPARNEVRFIQDSERNKRYFDIVQAIIAKGQLNESSCQFNGRDQILSCIQTCNSPGPRKRGPCCCVAPGSDFLVGLAGSCRYRQVLSNWTNVDTPFMTYQSRPLGVSNGERPYFDEQSCDATTSTNKGFDCSCDITWRLELQTIREYTPLPTPSVSPTPVSPTPSASRSPPPTTAPPTTTTEAPPATATRDVGPITGPPVTTAVQPSISPRPQDLPPVVPGGGDGDVEESAAPSEVPVATTEVSEAGTANSTPTSESDDICVDARWLTARGALPEDLVHATHRVARALCPDIAGLPCGTANHGVRVNGERKVTSYEALCARADVTCRSVARMQVNSVWSHKWAETAHGGESAGPAVRLTMLDVRYPAVAQMALHRVMRALRGVGAV